MTDAAIMTRRLLMENSNIVSRKDKEGNLKTSLVFNLRGFTKGEREAAFEATKANTLRNRIGDAKLTCRMLRVPLRINPKNADFTEKRTNLHNALINLMSVAIKEFDQAQTRDPESSDAFSAAQRTLRKSRHRSR